MIVTADLPDDIDALKAIIRAQQEQNAVQAGVIDRKETRGRRWRSCSSGFGGGSCVCAAGGVRRSTFATGPGGHAFDSNISTFEFYREE